MVGRGAGLHDEGMLRRLAHTCVRHRRAVLAGWLLFVIAAVVAAGQFGGAYGQNGRLPGTDSDRAYELLSAGKFPSTESDLLVVKLPDDDRPLLLHPVVVAAAGARRRVTLTAASVPPTQVRFDV